MIIDVTDLSEIELGKIVSRIEFQTERPNPVGSIPWQLDKPDDNANTPVGHLVYSGTIDRTFEVGLTGGNRPVFLSYKKESGDWAKFIKFPAPTKMTVSSTVVKIELIHHGNGSGYSLIKCPPASTSCQES